MLREPANVVFAPNLGAVDVYVEHAAGALDQLRLDAELILDRPRQTGGRGIVVSLHAVFNRDIHGHNSFIIEC